ncbi:MAG: GNAT family N-acetyltransferase [Candidatus Binataceae bacterium]|nr:GNAT family N-acetyltransferase [Candidatus Binataceae bacterium]
MLYYAAHMDESGEPAASARTNPALAPYVEGWGRAGDLGVIAEITPASPDLPAPAPAMPIGAAWLRPMPPGWPLTSHVDSATPELAIAVEPAHLGRGVGALMLTRLLAGTAAIYPAVALSVRSTNPARRLYQRLGFTVVAEIPNRVGTTSLVMRATLTREA